MRPQDRGFYGRIHEVGCKNLVVTKWGRNWLVLDKEDYVMIGHPTKTKADAIKQAYDRQLTTYGGNEPERHPDFIVIQTGGTTGKGRQHE